MSKENKKVHPEKRVDNLFPAGEAAMADLNTEFKFFLENRNSILKQHLGKVVVIKDKKIIGVYNSKTEAVKETRKTHEMGTFLVQKCDPGDDSVTMTFHSRFAFAR